MTSLQQRDGKDISMYHPLTTTINSHCLGSPYYCAYRHGPHIWNLRSVPEPMRKKLCRLLWAPSKHLQCHLGLENHSLLPLSGTLRRWCPNTRAHLEGAHADAQECDAQRP
jgi:hypothetical protein